MTHELVGFAVAVGLMFVFGVGAWSSGYEHGQRDAERKATRDLVQKFLRRDLR